MFGRVWGFAGTIGPDRRELLCAVLCARCGRESRNALPRNGKRRKKDGTKSTGICLRFGCRIKAGGCKRRPPIHSSPQCGLRSGDLRILSFSALGTPAWGICQLQVHRPAVRRPERQISEGEPAGITIRVTEKSKESGESSTGGVAMKSVLHRIQLPREKQPAA